jgi:hypothetical protein
LEDFGFQAFYKTDELNRDYMDPCLYLNVEVVNVSNIFLTKLQIVFKDCTNGIVFQSDVGSSEERERHESFNEALTNALKSVRYLNYKFNGKKTDLSNTEQVNAAYAKADQAKMEQVEVADLRTEQAKIEKAKLELAAMQAKLEQTKIELAKTEQARNEQAKVHQVAMQQVKANAPEVAVAKTAAEQARIEAATTQVIRDNSKIKLKKSKQTKTEAVSVEQVNAQKAKSTETIVLSDIGTSANVKKMDVIADDVLFATPIENGFQLKDASSKIVLVLIKTIQPDYFNANIDKKYGLVFKKNNQWVFEYYLDGKLIAEALNITF